MFYNRFNGKGLAQPVTQGSKNMIYTVALEDGTVGKINDNTLDGQSAEAFVGEMAEVLSEAEY